MKRCRYCGAEIPDSAAFCPSCGKKVREEAVYQNGRRYEEISEVPKRNLSALAPIAGVALALLLCVIVFFSFIKPKVMDRLGIEIKGPSAGTEEQSDADAEKKAADDGDKTKGAKSEFPKTMYVNSEDGLMLRKGPGPENEVVGSMAYGKEIKVEKLEKGWAYTTVDGEAGWCSSEYLTEKKEDIKKEEQTAADPHSIVQPSNVAEQGHTGRVTAEDGVNVRTGPGTEYDIIDGLPYEAEAIERGWQDGWVYIEYNGRYGWISTDYFTMAWGREKPAIYLYPTEKTDVDVKVVLKTGEFTKTIPRSDSGEWSVTADPSGLITDKASGKSYDYIFWESTDDTDYDWSEGYVVAGYETEDFLSTVLPEMGLNEKETRQFKEYWLPRLGRNKYNLVTFQGACYTESAELEVQPKPDSVLRLFMVFKGIDEPVRIKAPEIKKFERKGFTVVEWGGAEAKSPKRATSQICRHGDSVP